MAEFLIGIGAAAIAFVLYWVGYTEGCEHTKAMRDIDSLSRAASPTEEQTK